MADLRRDIDRRRVFTRRALLLAAGQAGVLCVLAGRLYYLQVHEAERYLTLAEDNRINLRVLAPPRGRILDRRGRPLALNRQDFRLILVAEQAGDVATTLRAVGEIVPVADEDRQRVLKEIARSRKFMAVAVRDNLSWEDVANIEVRSLDLPGVSVEVGQSRVYPYADQLSHVLGYVAPVAEGEADGDPLLQLPDFRIGKAGIEKVYDHALRGGGGVSQVEVNAYGRVIRELEHDPGQPGRDLTLTLDVELQRVALDRLGDESGSVVVLDVLSGDVLVAASKPGYDPNVFGRGVTLAEWRALLNDAKAPLINKTVSGLYAPGSTFKPVTALAALERGAVTPATAVFCSGATTLGRTRFHCWKKGGHGSLDLRRALMQSCDCYFYEAARRAGIDHIAAMGRRLGLGVTLGIDLPHEKAGLMPTESWKQKRFQRPWNPGETMICGIGQGYVLTTPMQLAVMTARLANGGHAVVPRLTRERLTPRAIKARAPGDADHPDLNPNHVRVVLDGLNLVVNGPGGTAGRAAIHLPGLQMGGKTGTSQVRRITLAERARGVIRNEHLPWEQRDHALFIGYAPVAAPRFACAVVIEHGGAGSKAAAPIARDVLIAVQRAAIDRDPDEPTARSRERRDSI